MENQILSEGCTVKALKDTEVFKKGEKYPVKGTPSGCLVAETPTGLLIALTEQDGTLTDACDDVRLVF